LAVVVYARPFFYGYPSFGNGFAEDQKTRRFVCYGPVQHPRSLGKCQGDQRQIIVETLSTGRDVRPGTLFSHSLQYAFTGQHTCKQASHGCFLQGLLHLTE